MCVSYLNFCHSQEVFFVLGVSEARLLAVTEARQLQIMPFADSTTSNASTDSLMPLELV